MYKSVLIGFLLTFIAINARSQDYDDLLNIEFEFGIGYSKSSTNNYFNDVQAINPGGGVGINIAFRYHFNYNWSAGLHFIIAADEISEYDPDLVLGYYTESPLSTSNLNLGFNGKYTYDLRRWQPYMYGGLGIVLGGITSLEYEQQVNGFTGIAMNLGLGIGYMASNQVMISTSILRNQGVAWWSRNPSAISINNQFNPGFWTISLNVSVFLPEEFY